MRKKPLIALGLALACSFAVYFSSQTKAIEWPVCVTAFVPICHAPTAIMTGEKLAMAQVYPILTDNWDFRGAIGRRGRRLTGISDKLRVLDVS